VIPRQKFVAAGKMAKSEEKSKAAGQIIVDSEVISDDAHESGSDLGTVQIHNSVIAGIARIAALNVPGVSELSAGFVEGFATALGTKRSMERGIKVRIDGEFVSLEVHVVMDYGVRIPHVAWQVQNEVRRAVEQMSGKTVSDVQVIVQGVKLPSARSARPGEIST
jgi:uncharacterized alkaline shock family protein YloU